MPDAVSLIKRFAQRQISLDQLAARIQALIRDDPACLADVQRTLGRARKAGLPPSVHQRLLAAAAAAAARCAGSGTAGAADEDRVEAQVAVPTGSSPVEACDMTEVGPQDPDRTTVAPPAAATFGQGRPDNIDNATGPSWPAGGDAEPEYSAGSMLRARFRLLSPLGEGGMGMVWKAIDLLKEEARDRNPYVAIKLLQGDFKEHPEAFVALQRETAKQQRLAHPNIATVFDFDRDTSTGTVYMTMEVLEGDDFQAFIRKLPEGGLPFEEAMQLIEQLSAGLSYAHENQLVHSDLKPGNCFITKDRTVKLLDFGIARASKTRTDAEGETTLFDPGELGALTPTYATIEMFEGVDPDPSDDIYALAIIAFQLLSGKHPYDRKSAPVAKELGLSPPALAKLSKRQNRALAEGLAFLRKDRTPGVGAFLEGLRPRKSYRKQIAAAVVAGVVAIGAAGYLPVVRYLDDRENQAIIGQITRGTLADLKAGLERARALAKPAQRAAIRDDAGVRGAVAALFGQGTEESIRAGLELISPFPRSWQQQIREDERVRRAIFDWYARRREAAFDPGHGKYDYPLAESQLAELAELYVDSAEVFRIRQELGRQKDRVLNMLDQRFNDDLQRGRLLPTAARDDISAVLSKIARIDPHHPLLSDKRLPLRFEELVRAAITAGGATGYERAQALLQASRAYAPDDPALENLRFQVARRLRRQRDRAVAATLEARLRREMPGLETLTDYQRVGRDLAVLSSIDPDHVLVTRVQTGLQRALDQALEANRSAANWAESERLLLTFAPWLDVDVIITRRARLSAARTAAGAPAGGDPTIARARLARLATLIGGADRPDAEWERALATPLRELLATTAAGRPEVVALREKLAAVYLTRAVRARERSRLAQANELIAKGRRLYRTYPGFASEQQAIERAEAMLREQQEQARRLAQIEGMKRTVLSNAAANRPDDAKMLLAQLGERLAADDAFVVQTAPRAIADAYVRLAAQSAQKRRWRSAVRLAEAGLALRPGLTSLEKALAGYRERDRQTQDITALREALSRPGPYALKDLQRRLGRVEKHFPDRFPALRTELGTLMAESITGPAVSSPRALRERQRALATLGGLFPDQLPGARQMIRDHLATSVRQLQAEDPRSAKALLAAAQSAYPVDRRLAAMTVRLPAAPSARAEEGRRLIEAGDLTRAGQVMAEASAADPDAPNLEEINAALEQRRTKALSDYRSYQRFVRANREREGRPYLQRAVAGWRDNPDPSWKVPRPRRRTARGACTSNLVGLGKGRGTCFDRIGAHRGPTLVVVPGRAGGAPFAIGKYEVSIAEFNAYCSDTRRCAPLGGDPKLPVTGISFRDAEAYVAWLSEKTKASYRLPTDAEWEFAALANGQQPRRNFNCTVKLGPKTIKGQDLVNARTGEPNGWGLTNYVGNAQEWVRRGAQLGARGGSHSDPLSKCDISLSRSHPGNPDPVTGFRVVRELG